MPPFAADVLRRCSASLIHFRWLLDLSKNTNPLLAPAELTTLSNLQLLNIIVKNGTAEETGIALLGLFRALEGNNVPGKIERSFTNLKEIIIEIYLSENFDTNSAWGDATMMTFAGSSVWGYVDSVLSVKSFEGLKKVTVFLGQLTPTTAIDEIPQVNDPSTILR